MKIHGLRNDGVRVRRLFGRERLVRWDEVESIEGDHARLVDGSDLALGAYLALARAAIDGPDLAGDLARDGVGLRDWLAGAHDPCRAAKRLLDAASTLGASDLHVEPDGGASIVRVRIEGSLVEFFRVATPVAERLCAALKGLAGCLPYRSDIPQEGRIARGGATGDVRASFLPTPLGERVALRLFGRLRTLDELGLRAEVRAALVNLLARPKGLVLVAGSTGAGKTTTIYAMLGHLAASRTGAHLSLEDPVEQRLRVAGIPVDQVELAPERGITGESMLAAALRQDVDVLAVGEIRTSAEARLAVHAAHTGRLVLAGIHAGDAGEAIARLVDLGAERALVDASLAAVLHQSLRTVDRRRVIDASIVTRPRIAQSEAA